MGRLAAALAGGGAPATVQVACDVFASDTTNRSACHKSSAHNTEPVPTCVGNASEIYAPPASQPLGAWAPVVSAVAVIQRAGSGMTDRCASMLYGAWVDALCSALG